MNSDKPHSLAAVVVRQLTGTEAIHDNGVPLSPTVLDFWRWTASDLAANNLRGHFAEFLVAAALEVHGGTRVEWDGCDLRTPSGLRIEVKSAAYLQSWDQEKHSAISFGIEPTHYWDSDYGARAEVKGRFANLYIFCVLKHKDKATLDPLNIDQWDFYVVPTRVLDETYGEQKRLSLSSLLALSPVLCRYSDLRQGVEQASSSVAQPTLQADGPASGGPAA